jgi:hypothetical protein
MLGLEGETDMEYLKEYIPVNHLDGYRVTYSFDLNTNLESSSMQMIVFGFEEDPYGYFGIGVVADPDEDNKYTTHGAGYWYWGE